MFIELSLTLRFLLISFLFVVFNFLFDLLVIAQVFELYII